MYKKILNTSLLSQDIVLKLIFLLLVFNPIISICQNYSKLQLKLSGTVSGIHSGSNTFELFDYDYFKTYGYPVISVNSALSYNLNKNFFIEGNVGYIAKGIKMYNNFYDFSNPEIRRLSLTLFSTQFSIGYKKILNQNNSLIFSFGPGMDIRVGKPKVILFSLPVYSIYNNDDYTLSYLFAYNKYFTPVLDFKFGVNSKLSKMGELETGVRFHFQTDPNYSASGEIRLDKDNSLAERYNSIFRISFIGLYVGWVINFTKNEQPK
jgi:hypothetical protein